jgi:hypothetical protein
MDQQPNRRRWERHPFDGQLRVVVDHATDRTIVDARGVRLSEGGICLFAAANLPVGSHVKVEFNSPRTHESVRVRGKVRNRSVYLYGVEFLSDEFEDQQCLARLSQIQNDDIQSDEIQNADFQSRNGFPSA